METFDNLATYLCKPFEKHVFTPLYRFLTRKKAHEVSDDERNLIRISQATLLIGVPIMLLTPVSLYLNFKFFQQKQKLVGNTEKYRRAATRSVFGLCVMTGMYLGMLVAYPKAIELKVLEQRKNQLEEFIKGEEFVEVFKPQTPVKSTYKADPEPEEPVIKKIEIIQPKTEYQQK